jgi:hypothetical protein
MSGAHQSVLMNQRSFIAPLPAAIGEAFGGGFFAGQISTTGDGVATHNLVIGPRSSAETNRQWKSTNTSTAGTSSVIDGPTNSANMNDTSHPAAFFCEGLTIGGFSDWYMPSKNELEICYYNLKPLTLDNNTGAGINANAVPSRGSNYTTSVPARTAATEFQSGGSEAFGSDGNFYFSSTEFADMFAWVQIFNDGSQQGSGKDSSFRVRAVRRVPV